MMSSSSSSYNTVFSHRVALGITGATALISSNILFRDLADISQWIIDTDRDVSVEVINVSDRTVTTVIDVDRHQTVRTNETFTPDPPTGGDGDGDGGDGCPLVIDLDHVGVLVYCRNLFRIRIGNE